MKVLIIEDERPAAEKLKSLLKKIDEHISVIDTLETVEASVKWFKNNPAPNLVLMDIQLDDGISFEIFAKTTITTPVIFTTAYDEYAIRAFKVNSVDYLLKPIDIEALRSALNKYNSVFYEHPVDHQKIDQLYQELVKPYKNRFFVKLGLQFHSILVEDIECFFVRERATFLRTKAGKVYDVDYSLDQIQNMINAHLFFRINRSFLININCINKIYVYSSNRLKIKLTHDEFKDDLIVSREKVNDFKQWMDR